MVDLGTRITDRMPIAESGRQPEWTGWKKWLLVLICIIVAPLIGFYMWVAHPIITFQHAKKHFFKDLG